MHYKTARMVTQSRATALPREKNHRSIEQDTALSHLSSGSESWVTGLAVPNTGWGNRRIRHRHKEQFKPALPTSEKVICLLKLHCLVNMGPRLVGPQLCYETLIKRKSAVELKTGQLQGARCLEGTCIREDEDAPASLWNVTNGDDTESTTQKQSCCWPATPWRAARSLGLLIIV